MSKTCCDLRAFSWGKFGWTEMICVKKVTFCNSVSGQERKWEIAEKEKLEAALRFLKMRRTAVSEHPLWSAHHCSVQSVALTEKISHWMQIQNSDFGKQIRDKLCHHFSYRHRSKFKNKTKNTVWKSFGTLVGWGFPNPNLKSKYLNLVINCGRASGSLMNLMPNRTKLLNISIFSVVDEKWKNWKSVL